MVKEQRNRWSGEQLQNSGINSGTNDRYRGNAAGGTARTMPRQEDTVNLKELFWALAEHWKLIFAAMLTGALIAGAYHVFLLKPSYQADASIFINSNETVLSFSDLQLSSALTTDYAEILKSRTVLKDVIEDLKLDMDFRQLRSLVSISNPTDSHIICITVTCGDKELCRDIANDLMNVGIDRIYQVIGSSDPTVVDTSEASAVEDITPGLKNYVLRGAAAGAFLACALAVIRFLTDTTIKTEEDIRKILRMPLLAEVPYFDEKNS